jgi:hypothetical protein
MRKSVHLVGHSHVCDICMYVYVYIYIYIHDARFRECKILQHVTRVVDLSALVLIPPRTVSQVPPMWSESRLLITKHINAT